MTYCTACNTLNNSKSNVCICFVLYFEPLQVSMSLKGLCFLLLSKIYTIKHNKKGDSIRPHVHIAIVAVISNKLEGSLLILLVRCCSRLIMRGKAPMLAHYFVNSNFCFHPAGLASEDHLAC